MILQKNKTNQILNLLFIIIGAFLKSVNVDS